MKQDPIREEEALAEYYKQQEEVKAELLQQDPVYQECGFVSFVSKSKGRKKNGERRYRRNWKEVELYRRYDGFHLPHNFPFDEESTELLDRDDPEALQDHMKEVCKPTGGKGKTDDWAFRAAVIKGMRKTKGIRFFPI